MFVSNCNLVLQVLFICIFYMSFSNPIDFSIISNSLLNLLISIPNLYMTLWRLTSHKETIYLIYSFDCILLWNELEVNSKGLLIHCGSRLSNENWVISFQVLSPWLTLFDMG